MAGSLQEQNKNPYTPGSLLAKIKAREGQILKLMEKGYTVQDIANHWAKGDKRRMNVIRTSMYRVLAHNEHYVELQHGAASGILQSALPDVAQGLARRAKTGRAQEAKLVFEASGFHNPKTNVEHSGEVVVKLDIPRPPVVSDKELGTGEVIDAEVVDESG